MANFPIRFRFLFFYSIFSVCVFAFVSSSQHKTHHTQYEIHNDGDDSNDATVAISSRSTAAFTPMQQEMASPYRLAFVTVPSIDVARTIAQTLVQRKLAACVNIVPQVESIYMWEGKVESSNELLLKIKTHKDKVQDLISSVKENHPYQVCEVISVPIEDGNPSYLQWIDESLAASPQ